MFINPLIKNLTSLNWDHRLAILCIKGTSIENYAFFLERIMPSCGRYNLKKHQTTVYTVHKVFPRFKSNQSTGEYAKWAYWSKLSYFRSYIRNIHSVNLSHLNSWSFNMLSIHLWHRLSCFNVIVAFAEKNGKSFKKLKLCRV